MTDRRYAKQARYAPLGEDGQARLAASRAVLVGCGALGTHLAQLLVRAGVGALAICDRDVVELDNLPRQVLFDEADARDRVPKAAAAVAKLRAVNSACALEARVVDVSAANVEALVAGAGCVLDGTDNFETRFLLNDACVKLGVPWVHAGCVGASGQVLPVIPGVTACLACWLGELPPPGEGPTCDTAGVLGPAVAAVAALQAGEALKILAGRPDAVLRGTHALDLWTNRHQVIGAARDPDCPVCAGRRFEHLGGAAPGGAAVLCGRDAVQVTPAASARLDLAELERRLSAGGPVVRNAFLVRLRAEGCELTVFEDARAIVQGTSDPARARALYARYVGA